MEQLSFGFIEKTTRENIISQMKAAVNKGIVPGAIITFDDPNDKYKYLVMNLNIGNDEKVNATLRSESGFTLMSYPANSERLIVVGFYK